MRRLLLLLGLALLATAAPAEAASLDRAGRYLESSLDARGCAREPGGTASANLSAWVALGLAAAGRDARRPAACIADHARHLERLTDVEICILGLVAADADPRAAGGRDLVRIVSSALRDGRIGTTVASNQFGILALRAAGAPVPAAARRTLLADQNADGGWPVGVGGDSDSNLTASGIDAAIAAGIAPTDRAVTRAVAALTRFRAAGGGYALTLGSPADAQSTGWALSGLAAVRRNDAAAERWLGALQRADGSFGYQRGVRVTPVWVTAQATMGLASRAFPMHP